VTFGEWFTVSAMSSGLLGYPLVGWKHNFRGSQDMWED